MLLEALDQIGATLIRITAIDFLNGKMWQCYHYWIQSTVSARVILTSDHLIYVLMTVLNRLSKGLAVVIYNIF